MGRTTYRAILLGTFLLPLFLLASYLANPKFSVKIRPDTQSYVLSSPYRTFLYPAFINLFSNEESQKTAALTLNGEPFRKLVAVQKTFTLLAFAFLLVVCHRFVGFSHLALISLGFLMFERRISYLIEQVSWVQPEGLVLPWLLTLLTLSIELMNRKRVLTAYCLAVFLFLGILLSPRLVCFSPLCILPFFVLKNSKDRLFPVVLLSLLIFAKCFATRLNQQTFALSPMNGFYTIANVLRMADTSAVEAFSTPKERTFLMRSLAARDRRSDILTNDWMTWTFATRFYRETFPERSAGVMTGKDVIHMNKFYSQFFPTLFIRNASFRMAWLQSAGNLLQRYLRENAFLNMALLFFGCLAAFQWLRTGLTLFVPPVLCVFAHWTNIGISVPFSGLVTRYTVTTEVLACFSVFLFFLYLWDKCAELILKRFHVLEQPLVE